MHMAYFGLLLNSMKGLEFTPAPLPALYPFTPAPVTLVDLFVHTHRHTCTHNCNPMLPLRPTTTIHSQSGGYGPGI